MVNLKNCSIITMFNYLAKWSSAWLLIKVGRTALYKYTRVSTGEISALLLILLRSLQMTTT